MGQFFFRDGRGGSQHQYGGQQDCNDLFHRFVPLSFSFVLIGPVHKKTGSFLSKLPGKCMRIRCVQRHRIIWRRAKQLSNAPVTEYARETCIRQHMLPDSFFIAFLYIAIPPSEMR